VPIGGILLAPQGVDCHATALHALTQTFLAIPEAIQPPAHALEIPTLLRRYRQQRAISIPHSDCRISLCLIPDCVSIAVVDARERCRMLVRCPLLWGDA
jgi:hypothetical protein